MNKSSGGRVECSVKGRRGNLHGSDEGDIEQRLPLLKATHASSGHGYFGLLKSLNYQILPSYIEII